MQALMSVRQGTATCGAVAASRHPLLPPGRRPAALGARAGYVCLALDAGSVGGHPPDHRRIHAAGHARRPDPDHAGRHRRQPEASVARCALAAHRAFSAGALLLAAGFLGGQPALFSAAAATLGLSIAGFLGATGRALSGVPSTSPTIRGIKFALIGLGGAVALGILLALTLAVGWALPLATLLKYERTFKIN